MNHMVLACYHFHLGTDLILAKVVENATQFSCLLFQLMDNLHLTFNIKLESSLYQSYCYLHPDFSATGCPNSWKSSTNGVNSVSLTKSSTDLRNRPSA